MRLVFAGEGPSDLGSEKPTPNGVMFEPGPMAWIVDKLLERFHTRYSLLELHLEGIDCISHVHETELASLGRKGSPLFPGVKFGKDTAFYTRNAQVLGLWAKRAAAQENQAVIAVLFRDGDGTRSTPAKAWQEKVDSMHRGFAMVEYYAGVPMLPRPKSEAWLLCALRPQHYANCASLEDASGNDDSQAPLKDQLAAICGGQSPSADEQAEWVKTGRIDPFLIDMPSFNAFKDALCMAATNAGFPLLR